MKKIVLVPLVLLMFVAAAPPKKDAYPRACVDCHAKERKLSTLMAKPDAALAAKLQPLAPKGVKLTGKHPAVAFAFKDVPAKCMTCHSATSKTAPQFPLLIHTIHVPDAHAECTNCHKFDGGEMRVPSGGE